MVRCEVCDEAIHPERLEIFPQTTRCPAHSDAKPVKGYMVAPHKTGAYVVIIPTENKEAIRQADRANRRAR